MRGRITLPQRFAQKSATLLSFREAFGVRIACPPVCGRARIDLTRFVVLHSLLRLSPGHLLQVLGIPGSLHLDL